MNQFYYSLTILLTTCFHCYAQFDNSPKIYSFVNEPIDVIIPTITKDKNGLDMCIEGIEKNVQNLRRIIVISPQKYTDKAEWFDENNYPFSKFDIALYLNHLDEKRAQRYTMVRSRLGWYFQQLLKFYAPYVIPGISSNMLIVDADVIFFRPVSFINEEGGGNYCPGTEYNSHYFEHANRLLPGLTKLNPSQSGITHHMLFQKAVLDDLFEQVESYHKMDFWKAFCLSVNLSNFSGASEYEIYFNFVFARSKQVKIRPLYWANSGNPKQIKQHITSGYDFVAYHTYMRKP